jgi:uncharacterized metal-binding protein
MNDKAKKKLEGEGSYVATRRYNAGVVDHVQSGNVEQLAKKAAKALDGAEAAELEKAEKLGKRGPRAVGLARPTRKVSARR